jgi:hypothetical protein
VLVAVTPDIRTTYISLQYGRRVTRPSAHCCRNIKLLCLECNKRTSLCTHNQLVTPHRLNAGTVTFLGDVLLLDPSNFYKILYRTYIYRRKTCTRYRTGPISTEGKLVQDTVQDLYLQKENLYKIRYRAYIYRRKTCTRYCTGPISTEGKLVQDTVQDLYLPKENLYKK